MKMDVWKKHGQYSLEIPPAWSVVELEDCTEIIPKNEDAAIHVSAFKKKTKSVPQKNDAVTLVENFAQKNNLRLVENMSIENNEHGCSCFGSFFGNGDPNQPNAWVVKGLVGSSKGVLGTLCLDETKGSSYSEGLAILGSLNLEEDK